MILIIGGGPAGRTAAVRLGSAGREVTLVEGDGLGGQCLHHGCMVVCALNDLARILHTTRELHRQNLLDSRPGVNLSAVFEQMGVIRSKIEGVLQEETRNAGVRILKGTRARIQGKTVHLGSDCLAPDVLVIATGSHPRIPDIPGINLPGVYTAHTLQDITHVPETLTIMGCGTMAAEWAYIFSCLGSEVHMICRRGFLKGEDTNLRSVARKELNEVSIHEHTSVRGIRKGKEGLLLDITAGNEGYTLFTDALLLAAGLVPSSDMVEGIVKGEQGEIIVDQFMRTSVTGVYACGDVTGPPCLTPVARRQGLIAAADILGEPSPAMPGVVPRTIHLKNELASATVPGIDQDRIRSFVMPGPAGPGTFWWVPAGLTGFAKMGIDTESGKIVNVISAGPTGGTVAQYMGYLMERGIDPGRIEHLMEVHPSTDGIYGLARYASGLSQNHQKP